MLSKLFRRRPDIGKQFWKKVGEFENSRGTALNLEWLKSTYRELVDEIGNEPPISRWIDVEHYKRNGPRQVRLASAAFAIACLEDDYTAREELLEAAVNIISEHTPGPKELEHFNKLSKSIAFTSKLRGHPLHWARATLLEIEEEPLYGNWEKIASKSHARGLEYSMKVIDCINRSSRSSYLREEIFGGGIATRFAGKKNTDSWSDAPLRALEDREQTALAAIEAMLVLLEENGIVSFEERNVEKENAVGPNDPRFSKLLQLAEENVYHVGSNSLKHPTHAFINLAQCSILLGHRERAEKWMHLADETASPPEKVIFMGEAEKYGVLTETIRRKGGEDIQDYREKLDMLFADAFKAT
jgi:hypothetical protein